MVTTYRRRLTDLAANSLLGRPRVAPGRAASPGPPMSSTAGLSYVPRGVQHKAIGRLTVSTVCIPRGVLHNPHELECCRRHPGGTAIVRPACIQGTRLPVVSPSETIVVAFHPRGEVRFDKAATAGVAPLAVRSESARMWLR